MSSKFRIRQGLQPTLGLDVNGQTAFLSNNLNETQHELAEYAIVSWQHSEGALNWQTSLSARYTSLHFVPDCGRGFALQRHRSGCVQEMIRPSGGKRMPRTSSAMRIRCALACIISTTAPRAIRARRFCPSMTTGVQTSNVPLTIIDNGTQVQQIQSVYLQDEWQVLHAVHDKLRFALRSLQRVFQRRPAQPARQLLCGSSNPARRCMAAIRDISLRLRSS